MLVCGLVYVLFCLYDNKGCIFDVSLSVHGIVLAYLFRALSSFYSASCDCAVSGVVTSMSACVCLPQVGVLLKRLNLASCQQCYMIAQDF